jgi:hypothetical protein
MSQIIKAVAFGSSLAPPGSEAPDHAMEAREAATCSD